MVRAFVLLRWLGRREDPREEWSDCGAALDMHTHVSLVLGVHAFNCPHSRFQLHLTFLKILLGPILRNGSAESFPGWSFVVPPSSLGCFFACHFLHRRLLFVRWVPVAPSIFSSFSAGPHPAALCFCEVGCGLFRAPAGCYCLVLFGAMQVRVCGCV